MCVCLGNCYGPTVNWFVLCFCEYNIVISQSVFWKLKLNLGFFIQTSDCSTIGRATILYKQ